MISNRLVLRSVSWFLVIVFFPTAAFATDTYLISDGSGNGSTLTANGTNVIGPGATTGNIVTAHGDTAHYHGVLNGVADPNPDGGADQSGWGHVSLVVPATSANPAAIPTNSTDTVYLTTGENPGGDKGSSGGGQGSYALIDLQMALWLAQLMAAMALPGLNGGPVKGNQGSANGSMRTTTTAQAQLDTSNGETAPNLSENELQEAAKTLGKALNDMDSADAHMRDSDLAKEAAELVKQKEAEEAGKAALAQANSAPQQVLSLLRG